MNLKPISFINLRGIHLYKLEPTTLSSTLLIREISYNLILLCVGDLGPNLEHGEGEGENRKGLKRLNPHDQVRGDLNTPGCGQTGQTGRVCSSPLYRLNRQWSFFLQLEVFAAMPPRRRSSDPRFRRVRETRVGGRF